MRPLGFTLEFRSNGAISNGDREVVCRDGLLFCKGVKSIFGTDFMSLVGALPKVFGLPGLCLGLPLLKLPKLATVFVLSVGSGSNVGTLIAKPVGFGRRSTGFMA